MNLSNVIKCKNCRRIFTYLGYGAKLCPECRKIDEKEFQKVKNYLRDFPGRTLNQTAEDCDVKPETIRNWLREERLEYTEAKDTGLICENCGKPIISGHLCEECKMAVSRAAGELSRSMERAPEVTKVKTQSGDRMRFLSREK